MPPNKEVDNNVVFEVMITPLDNISFPDAYRGTDCALDGIVQEDHKTEKMRSEILELLCRLAAELVVEPNNEVVTPEKSKEVIAIVSGKKRAMGSSAVVYIHLCDLETVVVDVFKRVLDLRDVVDVERGW